MPSILFLRGMEGAEMKKSPTIRGMVCLVLAAGALMSGCSKQTVTPGGVEAAGQYVLVSVDGKDIPATVSHGGVSLKVLSGAFTINADGTCRSKTVFVPPNGTKIEREVDATYSMAGSTLTMQWEGAGITIGTVEGNTFTMDNEGMLFIYEK